MESSEAMRGALHGVRRVSTEVFEAVSAFNEAAAAEEAAVLSFLEAFDKDKALSEFAAADLAVRRTRIASREAFQSIELAEQRLDKALAAFWREFHG